MGIRRETSGCFVDNFVNSRQSLENGRFFYRLVHKRQNNADVQRYLSVPTSSWEVGLTTVPFKYRFGNTTATDTIPNDASTAVNAGGYVGRRWARSRFYTDPAKSNESAAFTLAVFLTPIVIALAPETTNKEVTKKSNELGIGYGVAAIFSYSDINAGLLLGIDSPLSGDSDKWIYADRPWIGFGIGYKLGILGSK